MSAGNKADKRFSVDVYSVSHAIAKHCCGQLVSSYLAFEFS